MFSIRNDEQQINLSVGRLTVLRYLSIRKTENDIFYTSPNINVVDIEGNIITSDNYDTLPKNKMICVLSDVDGVIEVFNKNIIKERRNLKANNTVDIDNICFGDIIKIYQGLDCVWESSFTKQVNTKSKDEDALLIELNKYKGINIRVDHSIGALIKDFNDMPKIQSWIKDRIRKGYINANSLKVLRRFLGY